jgi:hypothetical protein
VSGRKRSPLAIVIAAIAASVTACTATPMASVPSLVPASPQQFMPALSVSVTRGSTVGLESNGGTSVWWLNGRSATVTVYNNSTVSKRLVVVAVIASPRCESSVNVILTPPSGAQVKVLAGQSGANLRVPVTIAASASSQIGVEVIEPACHIAGDSRPFAAGLFSLRVLAS